MAPLTRKRKLLKHDEIEDPAVAGSDLEQDASTSRPSLLKCTGGKNPRTTLSQDDEASLPLQTSGTYARVAKKAKINTQDARRDLEKTARDLQAQIKTRIICHAASLYQLPTIKELVTKNLPGDMSSILPHTCSSYPGQTSGIANDSYHKAIRTLDGFRILMKDYEELSQRENDIRMTSCVRWKQDSMDLQLLGASLMGHSMKCAEQNIIPNASRISTNIGNDDIDHIAAELLQETWPQKTGETWGNTTEGILQTLFGLAVFLP